MQEAAELRRALNETIHQRGHRVADLARASGVSGPTVYGRMKHGSRKHIRRSTYSNLMEGGKRLNGGVAPSQTGLVQQDLAKVSRALDELNTRVAELASSVLALHRGSRR